MANAKISNATAFPPVSAPIADALVFAAASAGVQAGPTMLAVAETAADKILGVQGPGANGTAGQVLTSQGGSAAAAWANAANPTGTYHNVTSFRAIGVQYTNSQSVPIFVSASLYNSVSGGNIYLTVNGINVMSATSPGNGYAVPISGFVNPGDNYEFTTFGSGTWTVYECFERY